MRIDFHTHTFPHRIAERAIQSLQEKSHARAFSDGTASGLRAAMEEAGIGVSVVLPVATNPDKVASINDVSLSQTGQDGLIYFGCMHPLCPDWEKELERIAAGGLQGIKIHPVYQQVLFDDPRFLRILQKAFALDLIVVTHAGDDIGFPGEVFCEPERIRQTLDRIGGGKLVLAHMGGWKNWDRVENCLSGTGVYLDTAFSLGEISPLREAYYTAQQCQLLGEEQFCRIVESFGADRILFGSDSPWASPRDTRKAIEATALSDTQKQAIFGGNACRLLGLSVNSVSFS